MTPGKTAVQIKAVRLLFGLEPDVAAEWPGISVFCDHLEKSLAIFMTEEFRAIWRLLRRPTPASPEGCWDWLFAVVPTLNFVDNGKFG